MRKFLLFAIILQSNVLLFAQKTMNVEGKVTDNAAQLGEGAMWDYRTNLLYWIDIEGKSLHRYNPETKQDKVMTLHKRPGTVVLTKDVNSCVVALEDTICEVSMEKNTITAISGPSFNGAPVRFNDGKCDPLGNFWIGTVDCKDYANPIAKLYRMEADKTFTVEKEGVTISNGIAWSPDGKKMYYIDSPTRTVVAYDIDPKTGNKSNPKVVINTPENLGTPDGSAIDAEGMLWIAQWGGACVTRWNPNTGEMIGKVAVPAKNVTSVAFGGKNLDILYITTAKIAMSPEDEKIYTEAGHLFYLKPGVKGIKACLMK
jgi:sugar lactone lactonase YvrE